MLQESQEITSYREFRHRNSIRDIIYFSHYCGFFIQLELFNLTRVGRLSININWADYYTRFVTKVTHTRSILLRQYY